MRKTLGQVCYVRADQVFEDPQKEASRRALVMSWRRKQLALIASAHVRRIMREDGLARSIEELHDAGGRPPPNVDVARMVAQYKRLMHQIGWLQAIAATCREVLRDIDLVRFIKDKAQIEKDLMDRKAAREDIFITVAEAERGDRQLPPKLAAMIRDEVRRDIRRKETRSVRPLAADEFRLSMSRRMQDIMRYMFQAQIPDGESPAIAHDPEARYRFLFQALLEIEILIQDLQSNIYELQEYVDSADLLVMRYE